MPTTIETSSPACAQNPRISVVNASATTMTTAPTRIRDGCPYVGNSGLLPTMRPPATLTSDTPTTTSTEPVTSGGKYRITRENG